MIVPELFYLDISFIRVFKVTLPFICLSTSRHVVSLTSASHTCSRCCSERNGPRPQTATKRKLICLPARGTRCHAKHLPARRPQALSWSTHLFTLLLLSRETKPMRWCHMVTRPPALSLCCGQMDVNWTCVLKVVLFTWNKLSIYSLNHSLSLVTETCGVFCVHYHEPCCNTAKTKPFLPSAHTSAGQIPPYGSPSQANRCMLTYF